MSLAEPVLYHLPSNADFYLKKELPLPSFYTIMKTSVLKRQLIAAFVLLFFFLNKVLVLVGNSDLLVPLLYDIGMESCSCKGV